MGYDQPSVTALLRYRKYPTYQARFEVFSREGKDPPSLFHMTVFSILSYVNERDPSILGSCGISGDTFDASVYGEAFSSGMTGIDSAFFSSSEGTWWAILVNEPDNGKIGEKVAGREFSTDYAVRCTGGRVYMSVRTVCKEPVSDAAPAEAIRPGLIRKMIGSGKFTLTEEGIPEQYAFTKTPYELNANSSEQLASFRSSLLDEHRASMPILFIPENAFTDQEETSRQACAISRSAQGYAHAVLVKGPYRKMSDMLFAGSPVNVEKILEQGDIVFLTRRTDDLFSPRRISTESYRNVGQTIMDEMTGAGGTKILPEGPSVPEELKEKIRTGVPSSTSLKERREAEALQIREDIRNRHHAFMSRKVIDFDGVLFESDIILKKVMESEDKVQQIKALQDANERLKGQLEETMGNFNANSEKVSDLEVKNKRQESDLARAQKQNDDLIAETQRLNGEIKDLKELHKEQSGIPAPDTDGLISPEDIYPLMYLPDPKGGGAAVVEWAQRFYPDTLVITERARKMMFRTEGNNKDWKTLCFMLHYLHGYTIAKNERPNVSNGDIFIRKYDPAKMNLAVTPVGDMPAHFPDEYSVMYGETRYILNWHIKSGNTEGRDLLRIYFDYDPTLGRSIIGAMPDHLQVMGYK